MKHKIKILLVLGAIVVVAFIVGSNYIDRTYSISNNQKIKGTWNVVYEESSGDEIAEYNYDTWTFDDQKIICKKDGQQTRVCRFWLHHFLDRIKMTNSDDPNDQDIWFGVFSIKNDELMICISPEKSGYTPATFKTKPADNYSFLFVFNRAKP
jgi:uncharacterized protein (TIGR03067 family)